MYVKILVSLEFDIALPQDVCYIKWRTEYMRMKSIGKTLQYYRKKNGYTQADLATKMSEYGYPIKNGAISTWEKGSVVPNASQFLVLCQILNITDIYNTFINVPKQIPLRLIGVSAGYGEYVDDDTVENYIETTNTAASYALRISGNSMQPLYQDGDIILVQQTKTLCNNEVGIFYVDGEQYCKRLVNNFLVSENTQYKPIDISNIDCFRILGKVLGKYYG